MKKTDNEFGNHAISIQLKQAGTGKRDMKKTDTMFKNIHSQSGITGLETAIILIAFVTVASVLAYSVLSAGIFSAEKGKKAVYSGLSQAESSMQVRGGVYACDDDDDGYVETVQFTLTSVLNDEAVDMSDTSGNNSVVISYSDATHFEPAAAWTATHLGAARGGANMLEPGEKMFITVPVPDDATMGAHGTFTVQVIPPRGATITIQRTLPAEIAAVNDLN
jgi:archaeal flagellin FlaB